MILLGGEGGVTKKITKDHKGVGGVHQKITEDHDHKEGGGACKRINQTEGANKGNNYSQDQLSMGGSRGDIFMDQY